MGSTGTDFCSQKYGYPCYNVSSKAFGKTTFIIAWKVSQVSTYSLVLEEKNGHQNIKLNNGCHLLQLARYHQKEGLREVLACLKAEMRRIRETIYDSEQTFSQRRTMEGK